MANILGSVAERINDELNQAHDPATIKTHTHRTNILYASAADLRPALVAETASIRDEVSNNRRLFRKVRDSVAMFSEMDITKNNTVDASEQNKEREAEKVLDNTRELYEEMEQHLSNAKKGYQKQANLYNQILAQMHIFTKAKSTSKTEIKKDDDNVKGGGGGLFSNLLSALGLGGLLFAGSKGARSFLSKIIKKLLKTGLDKLKKTLTKAFKGFFKGLGHLAITAMKGAGKLLKNVIKAALSKGGKFAGKLGRGALKGGTNVLKQGVKLASKVGGKILRGGGVVKQGAKALARGVVRRGGVRAIASTAGRFLGGTALRTAGAMVLQAGAAVAGTGALPVIAAAAAAAAVGFGLYKVGKYFKLDEKLNAFITKVSKGKYNGIGDLLWGVATGSVAVDLFVWVKNKMSSMFEDSIAWLKEKAKDILGRFNPFSDDLAQQRAEEENKDGDKSTAKSELKTDVPGMPDSPSLNMGAQQTIATEGMTGEIIAGKNKNAGTIYLGDKTAYNMKSSDPSARQGAAKNLDMTPAQILLNVNSYVKQNPQQLNGSKVVLSTGINNDPDDVESVKEQIRVLKEYGAEVVVLKVPSSVENATKINNKLIEVVKQFPGVQISSQGVSDGAGKSTSVFSKDAGTVIDPTKIATTPTKVEKDKSGNATNEQGPVGPVKSKPGDVAKPGPAIPAPSDILKTKLPNITASAGPINKSSNMGIAPGTGQGNVIPARGGSNPHLNQAANTAVV